jgi:hypothetical protein
MVQQGALVSYGADFRLLGAQAARLVAKVLKGAKPSEMPVQTPEKLVLVINLTTAKAIGLEIPRASFERPDPLSGCSIRWSGSRHADGWPYGQAYEGRQPLCQHLFPWPLRCET